jgi:hypothetical protein
MCAICNSKFYTIRKVQKYCSEECEIIAKHLLDRYLNNQSNQPLNKARLTNDQEAKIAWIAKRQQHLAEVKIKHLKDHCEICYSPEHLCIHHIAYEPLETITLCRKCHGLLHSRYLKQQKVVPKDYHRV